MGSVWRSSYCSVSPLAEKHRENPQYLTPNSAKSNHYLNAPTISAATKYYGAILNKIPPDISRLCNVTKLSRNILVTQLDSLLRMWVNEMRPTPCIPTLILHTKHQQHNDLNMTSNTALKNVNTSIGYPNWVLTSAKAIKIYQNCIHFGSNVSIKNEPKEEYVRE